MKCNDDTAVLQTLVGLGLGFDCASKVIAFYFELINLSQEGYYLGKCSNLSGNYILFQNDKPIPKRLSWELFKFLTWHNFSSVSV